MRAIVGGKEEAPGANPALGVSTRRGVPGGRDERMIAGCPLLNVGAPGTATPPNPPEAPSECGVSVAECE